MTFAAEGTFWLDRLRLPAGVDPALQPYMDYIRSQVQPYMGDYHAGWLLSDWAAPVWRTRTKGTFQVDGVWQRTLDVSWDVRLPDGCQLTQPKYGVLLEACRRASFLCRQGLAGDLPALSSWRDFNGLLVLLCQWLVLESPRYDPARHAFALLDNEGIRRLLHSLGRGGWCDALSLVERVLIAIYREVFGAPCPTELLASPTNWPEPVRDDVIHWLKAYDGYSSSVQGKSKGLVSRKWLGRCVNASSYGLGAHPYLNAILRQFEPEWQHPHLLISGSLRTEYPGHRAPLLEVALESGGSVGSVLTAQGHLATLLKLSRHSPTMLPDPSGIRLKDASKAALRLAKPRGHTPFIPIDMGLRYLNEALRWVLLFGDALVDFYLAVHAKLTLEKRSNAKGVCTEAAEKNILRDTPQPDALCKGGFKFTRLGAKERSFENVRTAPTLDEALQIWVGAVTVLLGFMKPARDSEITSLPRVCLLRTRGGNYWLDTDLAKRTKAEVRARAGGKPIPVVVARAIQQVRKLNRGLVKIHEEKKTDLGDILFYLPFAKEWGSAIKMNSTALNSYLDRFCDYVNLPPDEYGRRWYLRIHEMRKWFLLLLFWSGRYDVLDAARWIAGHTDVEHIYAYIEREFPGDKIGELEAECAIDLLAKYDETRVITDEVEVGLAELHRRLLQRFNVKRLNLVRERDWHGLVHELFEQDYHLEPITLLANGQKRICIGIRQGERLET